MSYREDLQNWTYAGRMGSSQNVCLLLGNNEYTLFHSPENGIGVKRSKNLKDWVSRNGDGRPGD